MDGKSRKRIYQFHKTDSTRKRARQEQDRARQQGRINIKSETGRWKIVMEEKKFTSNEQCATFLLNCYDHFKAQQLSTPAEFGRKLEYPKGISSISDTGSHSEVIMSGVEDIQSPWARHHSVLKFGTCGPCSPVILPHLDSEIGDPATIGDPSTSEVEYQAEHETESSDDNGNGVVRGFIQAEEQDVSYYPDPDSDSDSYCEESGDTSEYDELDITSVDREILAISDNDCDDDSENDDDILYSINHPGVRTIINSDEVYDEPCVIAYKNSLHLLAEQAPRGCCSVPDCGLPYAITHEYRGTAIYMTWECTNKHRGFRWCSQPRLKSKGVHAADFIMSCSILMSGNNYSKVALLAKFMNLRIFTDSFHHQVQALYACPAIEKTWSIVNADTLNRIGSKPLIMAGDGRNDSPGHSAQYCTYTLMEHDTGNILAIAIIDKREVQLKSTNMEALGLKRCLHFLQDRGMALKELVTDAHTQIGAVMKNEFPDIIHNWDVWHGAKNLAKKLNAAASDKKYKELAPWVKDITNHFWFCSEKAAGSEMSMKIRWHGLLNHVVNKHEWLFGFGVAPGKCEHGPLTEQTKAWMTIGSSAHNRLREIVLDTRLLNNMKHYVNFRHTGNLEAFHNHILMYAPKRFAFRFHTYRARNLLAVIDSQAHKDREIKKDKNGNDKKHRLWSKKSAIWTTVPVRVPKTYNYIPSLLKEMISQCLDDKLPLRRKLVLDEKDPRRIKKTIAPVSPPPTAQIAAKQKSRFGPKIAVVQHTSSSSHSN